MLLVILHPGINKLSAPSALAQPRPLYANEFRWSLMDVRAPWRVIASSPGTVSRTRADLTSSRAEHHNLCITWLYGGAALHGWENQHREYINRMTVKMDDRH
jgi:hypothetical protein